MGTLAPCRPPVFTNDAHEDGKDPSFNRPASAWKVIEAKLGKPSVGNQEHMLNHIVDSGIIHPKSPRPAPNEFDMCVVKVSKSLGFSRRRCRRFRDVVVG